ncbi:hypothetical protein GmHk_04G009823 [Glycine max]|nr:hypothetical protein GmHk_04G009823 [Glycine max]
MWYVISFGVTLMQRSYAMHKTNRYRLSLLDFVGVTLIGMTFSAGFAYLKGERFNNVVWALERFRVFFLRCDALPGVIVTDRDLALMNVVKTVFPKCTNLLCRFHTTRMSRQNPMFVDYVNETWIIPHKENFVTAWTNKVMHLGNTTTNRVESGHWALKRVLKNSLGGLCSVWDAMNNMITLQHTEIKASFETSTHVVGHVFKVTLYKRLFGMVSRYALNQIDAEYECVHYAGKNSSRCGCVMRTTHIKHQKSTKRDPSYWKYVDALHFVQNSNSLVKRSASSFDQPIPRRTMPMLDQFHPFIHDFIDNIVDAKADGNCGYRAIAALLGMGEDSWSLVCNYLLKELGKWSDDYIKLFGSTDRLKEIRRSLLVDGLSMVIMDKWMDITKMYNVILVSLSLQQNMTFFPLRSQLPTYSFVHRIICISHVYDNYFVQILLFLNLCNHLCYNNVKLFVHVQHVYLKDCCPLPPLALLWSRNCHPQTKQ